LKLRPPGRTARNGCPTIKKDDNADTSGRDGQAVPAYSARRCGAAACVGAVCTVATAVAAGGAAGDVLGTEGCFAGGTRGRGAGADREEWCGQDDAAEDSISDYAPDGGLGGDPREGAELTGSRDGVSSRTFRTGKYVPERVYFGYEQAGDR